MSNKLVTLELSLTAYMEIVNKLVAAGQDIQRTKDGCIDMSGIAIANTRTAVKKW